MDEHQSCQGRTMADLPTIAVVVCTKDRPLALRETLESIWLQSRRPDELIIIDDGRPDAGAVEWIEERCRSLGICHLYRRNPSPGLTKARNLAADLATSDVLLYLDDDVTCDVNLLARIASHMRDPAVAGVGARVIEPSFSRFGARLYQAGYRLAGWWAVSPRANPSQPRPRALNAAQGVRRATWLSGAAMALRRGIIREHRFDENLGGYALGEDREMGYRLASQYWLLESAAARVIHRRDPGPRADSRRFGYMTSHNYLYILRKNCRLGPGEWLVIGWSLVVLGLMHVAWAIAGDRQRHLGELRGMLEGLWAFFGAGAKRDSRAGGDRRARGDSPTNGCANGRSHQRGFSQQRVRERILAPGRTRVLFVTNRLEPGGAERMLVSLVRRLPNQGIEPVIACLKDAGPLMGECHASGVAVFDGLLRRKTDALVIQRLRRLIADRGIDVVVAAHSGGDRMFWSTLAGAIHDTPVVVWSHWFPREGEPHFERANRALFRLVERFVALGERHRSALIRHEGVPAGRIVIIRNGIDLAPFDRLPERSLARTRLGLGVEDLAVAIVANLRREKRHDVFIEAARRLAARGAHRRFFVIGDGPERQRIEAMAAASGVGPDVLRMLGARDDVPALLRAMDVCCLCSDVECFSVTMLEAAAAGCPFVGPNTGCLTEFLEHERTGLLIRPADVACLTDAIERLAGDAELRRSLASAARDRVRSGFGIDASAKAFADLFLALRRPYRAGPESLDDGPAETPRRVRVGNFGAGRSIA